jgi:poly-gamma-glutamate capsule biosynthesis protein CapA/YwtB (metallophosphatase superfamily)
VLVASDWAPIRAFDAPMRSDPESVYGDLLPELRAADLRIVNCECALTRAPKPVWKSGAVFKGHPAHVKALTAVPFDVACLGNNHVLDYGIPGLRETLQVLHQNRVRTVGAGLTDAEAHRPLSVNVRGTKIHIVNLSEGEDLTASNGGPGVFGWDLDRAAAAVARCRQQGGVVIVIAHCGLEYIPYPPPYVAAAFRAMIDAGADCVVGHHPHVPQGVELYRGRPIAYSLGNFAFYQLTDLFWRRIGFCLELHVERGRLSCVTLLPYRIDDSGLRSLDLKEAAEFERTMKRLSAPLRSADKLEAAWQAYLAYYGPAGFRKEVEGILEKMQTEPPKGAAMFRNRITTMQHRELWRDFLTRMVNGEKTRYSRGACRLVEEWFTRTTER